MQIELEVKVTGRMPRVKFSSSQSLTRERKLVTAFPVRYLVIYLSHIPTTSILKTCKSDKRAKKAQSLDHDAFIPYYTARDKASDPKVEYCFCMLADSELEQYILLDP